MPNEQKTDITPLFDINIFRFVITLTTKKRLTITDLGSVYRGQLGFALKQLSCLYDHFQIMDCSHCTKSDNCYYISLFSPLSSAQITKKETIKITPSPVKPFVFSFMTDEMNGIISDQKPFKIVFTVFGPAIQHIGIFSAAAIQASEHMGFTVQSLEKHSLEHKTINQALILEDWFQHCEQYNQKVTLRCHTPLSMKKNNQVINTQFSFLDIMKSIIRRLRDLKRNYGNDENMGHLTQEFYSMANTIHCSTDTIGYEKKNRYSYRQGKLLPISGFMGDVILTGNLQLFMPLLKASELVHIGRGTSSGNGFVSCFYL